MVNKPSLRNQNVASIPRLAAVQQLPAVAPSHIAARSAGPPPVLRLPTCLRCFKRIYENIGGKCEKVENVKCAYCAMGKPSWHGNESGSEESDSNLIDTVYLFMQHEPKRIKTRRQRVGVDQCQRSRLWHRRRPREWLEALTCKTGQ